MGSQDNVGDLLNNSFENHNYLPQKLLLEDIDQGVYDFIKNLNLSITNENGLKTKIPVIFLTQELWAERKLNWKNMRSEQGEEITRPFITIVRSGVENGTSPAKRTIPVKKKFSFVKVPFFDGTLKGYHLYKVPQPTYVDVKYEMRFLTHYMQDVNYFYESIMRDAFSDGQGYMNINGYFLPLMSENPSEENTIDDLNSERNYQVMFPLKVYGKLVDPTNFQKVNTITRVVVKIYEK